MMRRPQALPLRRLRYLALAFSDPTNAAIFATSSHPIDGLIRSAEKTFTTLLTKESNTLTSAAAAYRKRRGRHPPPGFKAWYEFATARDAIVIEEFWDQIYADLEPFWALAPGRIRADAAQFEMRIAIRDGKASTGSDWFWTLSWLSMIDRVAHLLPDMDIALNAMDEPRVVVPWETMKGYMKTAGKVRKLANIHDVVGDWTKWDDGATREIEDKKWENTKPYWPIAARGCPRSSAARSAKHITDFDHSPYITNSFSLAHMRHGFVTNTTLSTDICHQPDIQGLNGIFVEPITVSATGVLFPLFGGSKLSVNNDILLPAPVYWSEEDRFIGREAAGFPWAEKQNRAIWRGVATGGHNTETNWRAFQRHRFVAMNNGSQVGRSPRETTSNFIPPAPSYRIGAQRDQRLGEWISSWADVGFVDLMCSEGEPGREGYCNYTDPYFSIAFSLTMAQQFQYKYLPDIDGNSFSGRYLGFLRSTSLPIKATLWREWHDARLVAWKHFVPMDSRFGDWFGIMEYFLGYADKKKAHDEVAQRIAEAGRDWADKVLRKEDMQVYVLRLLLEYARIMDDNRDKLGWVDDLLEAEAEKERLRGSTAGIKSQKE
ncbi:glycosyltransferase family 90 protein [Podospora didyma]|uniref:Glycosyltransferase family 90 protein n=1 Tax=Podospora didyma TaxID=330526 RepID=A0AAE0NPE5_9PEZI|nr:glycosyltransferase family 90 protein [Podospora didyma]